MWKFSQRGGANSFDFILNKKSGVKMHFKLFYAILDHVFHLREGRFIF